MDSQAVKKGLLWWYETLEKFFMQKILSGLCMLGSGLQEGMQDGILGKRNRAV